MTSPNILYKYCDQRGSDILCNLRLKITPPNQFNDPFEFAPRMKNTVEPKQVRRMVKDKAHLRTLYDGLRASGEVSVGNFRTFRRLMRERLQEPFAQKIMEDYPAQAAKLRKEHVNMVSAEFGLLCLSSVPDDILMWSHYSRSHTGFVVGFNTSHPFFTQGPELLEIEYNEERVLMGHTVGLSDEEHRASIRALIRRKSPHWKYEGEWRQLHRLATCDREKGDNDRVNHFRSIPAELIIEIILGCRCDKVQEEVRTLLASSAAFEHVRVRRATMHDDEFKLVVLP